MKPGENAEQGPGGSQAPDSLLHRMAGPSSGKAGQVALANPKHNLIVTILSLAKDQTEINHIILEASKGSKFYEVRVFDGGFVVFE